MRGGSLLWEPVAKGMASKSIFLLLTFASAALAGCTESQNAGGPDANADTSSLGDDVLAQLRAVYTDQPMKGGQATPSHTFLQMDDGHIAFLHWNHADPAQATGLMFVGDAIRLPGCVGEGGLTQEMIDDGYVHFHKESAAQWDQGHHTTDDPARMGYWFRHIAAAPGVDPMGVGASAVGEVYPLMPSYENAPDCPPSGIVLV